jgi:colanic acid biosynthesis glycosyl transferase WcaI
MKIIILSQWCFPEPDLKALPFAKELKNQGHEVEILTGFPNYPGGKVYQGYHIRFFYREIIDGIKVNRVPLYPSHSTSRLGRIFNYISFALSGTFIGLFVTGKADIIYTYHPPATVGFAGLALKIFKRAKLFYDIQDFWPDTLAATGMLNSPLILRLIGAYMRIIYKSVDHLVVLSPGFRKKLLEMNVPDEKISVIYNWSIPLQNNLIDRNQIRRDLGFNDNFTILYAGNIGPAQALDTVLDAAEILSDQKVCFAFVGNGVSKNKLIDDTKKRNLSNVFFFDQVPASKVSTYLNAADILLVHLKNDPLFEITIPSKIQGYMSIGRPILAGVKGDANDLIQNSNSGICFESQDPRDLARAVYELINSPLEILNKFSDNSRRYYQENLSIEIGSQKFINLFKNKLNKPV